MFCFHKLLPHRIWIDRCRARASPEGASFHLDRQVSSEITTSGCTISFGSTGVEREHHEWVQHSIWFDRCRARASRVVATLHLVRHLSNQMKCCTRWWCSRSTLADPNAMRQPLVMLALDTCRSRCNAAPSGDALARHLSIQIIRRTHSWCSRSTPVEPNGMLHTLVMISLDSCRSK